MRVLFFLFLYFDFDHQSIRCLLALQLQPWIVRRLGLDLNLGLNLGHRHSCHCHIRLAGGWRRCVRLSGDLRHFGWRLELGGHAHARLWRLHHEESVRLYLYMPRLSTGNAAFPVLRPGTSGRRQAEACSC